MATWGSAVTGGTGAMKLGYDVSRSGSTLSVTIYVWTKYAVNDVNNTFVVKLNGTQKYSGAKTIKTTNNSSSGWNTSNIVNLGTYTTASSGSISIYATLTGIDTIGAAKVAKLDTSVTNYTTVTSGSISAVNNGNNTVTFSGRIGTSGTNNAVASSYVYYRFANSGSYSSISLGSTSNGTYSKSVSIPSGKTKVYFHITTNGRVGSASTSDSNINVVYYGNPGAPGKPVLSFSRTAPTLNETLIFSWSAASAGTNVQIVGYRLRIYKNDVLQTKINPNDPNATWLDTNSTATTYTLNPATFGFRVGDRVKLGIYAYGKNGKNEMMLNGGGAASAQVVSDNYTFINAGVIRLKKNGVWKEGQVYIKKSGVWKEVLSVYIKKNGVWKESI